MQKCAKTIIFIFLETAIILILLEVVLKYAFIEKEKSMPDEGYNVVLEAGYPVVYDFYFKYPGEHLWFLKKNTKGINAYGIKGREISEKKKEVFRIVVMSDSCGFFNAITYPERIQDILEKNFPGRYEVINASIYGYSSHQGVLMLEKTILSMKPDLIIVCYGWNDIWLQNVPDKKLWKKTTVAGFWGRFKVVNFAAWVKEKYREKKAIRDKTNYRVCPYDYMCNISTLISTARQNNIKIAFLTAASGIVKGGHLYEYASLRHKSGDIDEIENTLSKYNGMVRRICGEESAPLLDMYNIIRSSYNEADVFMNDCIHFKEYGAQVFAENVVDFLGQNGVINAEEYRKYKNYIQSYEYCIKTAELLEKTRCYDGAVKYYEKAYLEKPSEKLKNKIAQAVKRKKIYEILLEGMENISYGDEKTGIEKMMELKNTDIEEADIFSFIATAYFVKEGGKKKYNYEKAIFYAEKAAKMRPANIDFLRLLKTIYLASSRTFRCSHCKQKTIEVLKQIIKLDKEDYGSVNLLKKIEAETQIKTNVEHSFNEKIRNYPEDRQ